MKQQGKGLVIVRTHRSPYYTTLRLAAVEDPRLSYKSKGLHTYLISRPPGWKVFYHDLLSRSTDGKARISSAIKELKQHGYLRIELVRENGKITGTVWHVFEEPWVKDPEQPYPENQDTGKQYTENPQQSINNTKNKNQETTTAVGVVDDEKERVVITDEEVQAPSGQDRLLTDIVKGTPFEKVNFGPWLTRVDLVDQIDKLVQTYSEDYSKAKRPQALVISVMKNGAVAPDGYVPYSERPARAKAAEAEAFEDRTRKESDRAIQKNILQKFRQLSEPERNALLTEASTKLSPILGSSRGLAIAKAIDLLRDREKSIDGDG